MKHELKTGMKIRFSGPTSLSGFLYCEQMAKISYISGEWIEIEILDTKRGMIHRRQVTSVFVKKKRPEKLTVFASYDHRYPMVPFSEIYFSLDNAKKELPTIHIKEIIEFKEVRRHKVK